METEVPEAPRKRRKVRLPKVVSRAEALATIERAEARRRDPAVGARDRLGLELMYRAGLRVSEVCALMPRNLHRDGLIDVYDGKGGDGTAYFTPDLLLPVLDRWEELRAGWSVPVSAPLLCHRDGTPLHTRYFQRLVSDLKAECGIVARMTPHTYRHTFATELIEEGTPIHEVQQLLRHRHLATTAVYLSVRDEQLRRRISRRARWVPDPEDT